MSQDECVFCKIIKRDLPSNIIYEDELIISFLDIQPINMGHVLIIPKEHVSQISDVPENVAARMFNVAQKMNTAIRNSDVKAEGINFWLADGKAAFQDVFHSHLHCIPRYKDDGFRLKLPKDYHQLPSPEDLAAVAKSIKSKLDLKK